MNESHDLSGYAREHAREPLCWPRDHYFLLLFFRVHKFTLLKIFMYFQDSVVHAHVKGVSSLRSLTPCIIYYIICDCRTLLLLLFKEKLKEISLVVTKKTLLSSMRFIDFGMAGIYFILLSLHYFKLDFCIYRLHHYIFFNEDRVTITLIGFSISPKGDLIHNGKVSVSRIITKDLYNALLSQGVNLSENCTEWKRCDMIMKLSIVMGIKCFTTKDVDDPDESYVLTVDNLIKMLAIQTRFRCDIPVVVIGETGCGKTRLIRYMCDLAKQKSECKNLLIMKVIIACINICMHKRCSCSTFLFVCL